MKKAVMAALVVGVLVAAALSGHADLLDSTVAILD
jgi:hypothetical protein